MNKIYAQVVKGSRTRLFRRDQYGGIEWCYAFDHASGPSRWYGFHTKNMPKEVIIWGWKIPQIGEDWPPEMLEWMGERNTYWDAQDDGLTVIHENGDTIKFPPGCWVCRVGRSYYKAQD